MKYMFSNFINLSESDLDIPIYRIISVDRLLELFNNKVNGLVRPQKWDDPFENFILKSDIKFGDGDIGTIDFWDQYYAQCWTLHKASDAMWRIYSSDTKGVRIKSTIRKLAMSLENNLNGLGNFRCFIGKVEYLPNKKLTDFANNALIGFPTTQKFAKTLLVKRPAFKHEREIRLIYFDSDKSNNSDVYTYSINPHDLIEQIMIDPRLSFDEYKLIKKDIIKKTNYSGNIRRSLLYAPPKNMVLNFG